MGYFQLNQKYKNKGLSTRLIHAGNEPQQEFGGVSPALDFSSTFAQPAPGQPIGFDSGLAATCTMMNTLGRGDHLLVVDDVYGGVQKLLRDMLGPHSDVDVTFLDFNKTAEFKKSLKANTKIVWLESPTNPTLKMFDIKKIAGIVHAYNKNIRVCCDNTFMSPVNCNPLTLGADLVMHSVTKFIGGHSDVIAGCLCMNDRKLYDQLFNNTKLMGTGMSPFNAWLSLRGSKTLEVRMN